MAAVEMWTDKLSKKSFKTVQGCSSCVVVSCSMYGLFKDSRVLSK